MLFAFYLDASPKLLPGYTFYYCYITRNVTTIYILYFMCIHMEMCVRSARSKYVNSYITLSSSTICTRRSMKLSRTVRMIYIYSRVLPAREIFTLTIRRRAPQNYNLQLLPSRAQLCTLFSCARASFSASVCEVYI